MDNKMKTLLQKLNLNEEGRDCFNNAKLEKIVGNKEKTNYTFYIDNENTLSIDNYKQFINELKKNYKNLTVIEPDEKIDTYALMTACDKTLATYSTAAYEATYYGKVAIIGGIAPYEDWDCVYQAKSFEEFFKYIDDKNLQPKPKKNCYPYAYYNEIFGESFKYYDVTSLSEGIFCGIKLKSKA